MESEEQKNIDQEGARPKPGSAAQIVTARAVQGENVPTIAKPGNATQIVTAESVQAEDVPTVPIGSLQALSTLQPEVSVHSVAATEAVSMPTPLVVQPSEYRRSLGEWLGVWWDGIRPGYLPLSLMPVILGSVLAWTQSINTQTPFGHFHLTHFLGALLVVILLQVGAQLVNDYYDYLRGIDTGNVLGPGGLIQQGYVRPTRVLTTGLAALGIGALVGIVVGIGSGPLPYLYGLFALLCAYFYSATARALSSLALGEIIGFIVFGPMVTMGAYMIQTGGRFSPSALIYSLPLGLLAAAAIHANDMRDIENDAHAGKHTLVTASGLRWSRLIYLALLLCVYLVILVLGVPHGTPHLILIALWTLPILAVALTGVFRTQAPAGFHQVMGQTLKLLTFFTILLALALIITALIPVLPSLPTHLPFLP